MDWAASNNLMMPPKPLVKKVLPVSGENRINTIGTIWFVSRHPGAIAWAKQKKLAVDRWVTHLNPDDITNGDTVIGTLPVNLAAKICMRGAQYQHLSLNVPAEWRGHEMTADDLFRIKAELRIFYIEEIV